MDYIVDASVIIEYLITGKFTSHTQAFFDQLDSKDRLTIPEFCLLECTNVIWKQVRFNGMTTSDAQALLRVLRLLPLRRSPMKQLLDKSLTIAVVNNLAVYDSGYISLALHYGYPLLSLDQLQIRSAIAEGVKVIPITDF